MKIIFISLIFIVFSACANVPLLEKRHGPISPGEVRWVEFPVPDKGDARFTCQGEEVKFSRKGDRGQTVVVASYFLEEKDLVCQVEVDKKAVTKIYFPVTPKDYKAEQLKVDSKKIKLSDKDQKRVMEEQEVLNKIYASSEKEMLFNGPFVGPLNSVVTSVYGIKRVYNGVKKGQHLGTDFRAAIGDKIPATNDGKIVFAGELFYTGWTVIIDHGLDIFTVYGHLSKTLVKAGDMVKKGHIVALSGNTGRSSGPHLHWGVKIQGQYVDGFVLVDETKKAFRE